MMLFGFKEHDLLSSGVAKGGGHNLFIQKSKKQKKKSSGVKVQDRLLWMVALWYYSMMHFCQNYFVINL